MSKNLTILVILLLVIGGILIFNKKDIKKEQSSVDITVDTNKDIKVTPIEHATMMIDFGGYIIYTDPVGGKELFKDLPEPDLILITDIHGDHLDFETLVAVSKDKSTIIAPQAVYDEFIKKNIKLQGGGFVILNNGESLDSVDNNPGMPRVEAIPMYNLPESSDAPHVKGRGNGYVLEATGKRIYIAGDTAGIPEMRNLKNIDLAFVPMNLPYTMGVEEAADAVLAFMPKTVVPYHYRGKDGLADINKFRSMVEAGEKGIIVDLMDFYPKD